MMKIQYHNELVIADKISNDSQIELAKSLNKTMTENRGTNAMRPDFISSSTASYKESAREIVDNSGLSEPSKRVLSKVLDHQIYKATNNLLDFQRQETMSVQNSNIQADLEFRYAEVKAGANPDEQIRFHNAKIGMNQPGNTALMDLHAVRIRAQAQAAAVDNLVSSSILELKTSPDFRDVNGEFDFAKALRYVESPEFLNKVKDDKIVERIAISLTRNQTIEDKIYKDKADTSKGSLQVDILNNKIGKDNLSEDNRWLSLRATDRGIMASFADSKARSDRQEKLSEKSLNIQLRQERNNKQQLEAVMFEGKALNKIANGEYLDINEIIKDFSVENPYIQSKVGGAVSLFKSIDSSPELKMGLSEIKKAASFGLLDSSDYKNNLYLQGKLATELRTKYLTEPDFRGEKINEWLKLKLNPQVRSGFGKFLDAIFSPGQKEASMNEYLQPTVQSDLEFTAAKHNISVEEVKRRLGQK